MNLQECCDCDCDCCDCVTPICAREEMTADPHRRRDAARCASGASPSSQFPRASRISVQPGDACGRVLVVCPTQCRDRVHLVSLREVVERERREILRGDESLGGCCGGFLKHSSSSSENSEARSGALDESRAAGDESEGEKNRK
eukprot:22864-Rhodomonas_salina.6